MSVASPFNTFCIAPPPPGTVQPAAGGRCHRRSERFVRHLRRPPADLPAAPVSAAAAGAMRARVGRAESLDWLAGVGNRWPAGPAAPLSILRQRLPGRGRTLRARNDAQLSFLLVCHRPAARAGRAAQLQRLLHCSGAAPAPARAGTARAERGHARVRPGPGGSGAVRPAGGLPCRAAERGARTGRPDPAGGRWRWAQVPVPAQRAAGGDWRRWPAFRPPVAAGRAAQRPVGGCRSGTRRFGVGNTAAGAAGGQSTDGRVRLLARHIRVCTRLPNRNADAGAGVHLPPSAADARRGSFRGDPRYNLVHRAGKSFLAAFVLFAPCSSRFSHSNLIVFIVVKLSIRFYTARAVTLWSNDFGFTDSRTSSHK